MASAVRPALAVASAQRSRAAAWVGGWEDFAAYPLLHAPLDGTRLLLCAVLAACALLPFADSRGIEP